MLCACILMFMGPPELDCEWQDNGYGRYQTLLESIVGLFDYSSHILQDGVAEDMPTKQRFNKFLKEYQERLDHL